MIRNYPPCIICGNKTKEYGRKFCGKACYLKGRVAASQPIRHPKRFSEIKDGSVDAGLLLMSMVPKPDGGQWSSYEVAEVCGVSSTYIRMLEKTAIQKLRTAFTERGLANF
jgi:hypothetical protein